MNQVEISGLVAGIISIVAGIVVIVWPRIIAYIVGAYLVIVGVIALVAALR
jgi:uncharacterized membrane protein HdeD (DUF308 family)